ncbi:hypothetical protein ACFL4A_04280 [bacterium]
MKLEKQYQEKIFYRKKKIPKIEVKTKKFYYNPKLSRDPMKAQVTETGVVLRPVSSRRKVSKSGFYLRGLSLSGIVSEEEGARTADAAVLRGANGKTYLVKDGLIHDRKGNEVEDFSAVIKEDRVEIIKNDKVIKVLRLKS